MLRDVQIVEMKMRILYGTREVQFIVLAVLIEREPLMEKRTWLNALIVMR